MKHQCVTMFSAIGEMEGEFSCLAYHKSFNRYKIYDKLKTNIHKRSLFLLELVALLLFSYTSRLRCPNHAKRCWLFNSCSIRSGMMSKGKHSEYESMFVMGHRSIIQGR